MGVLINEFEIVPASEGDAGRRPNEADSQRPQDDDAKLQVQDVKTLLQRCEERRARVWAH